MTDIFKGQSTGPILTEMPKLVSNTEFGLDDEQANGQLLKKLIKKKVEVIEDHNDYQIFRTGNDAGYIILYSKGRNLIGYLIQYKTLRKKLTGNTVTQVALWRNPSSPYAQGVTKRMFYDYLLSNWPSIMSDQLQTDDGALFWRSRMAEAVVMGHKVGLANFDGNTVMWFDGRPDDFENWLKANNGWGDTPQHRALRYVIAAN